MAECSKILKERKTKSLYIVHINCKAQTDEQNFQEFKSSIKGRERKILQPEYDIKFVSNAKNKGEDVCIHVRQHRVWTSN